jgi:hypothetical protein
MPRSKAESAAGTNRQDGSKSNVPDKKRTGVLRLISGARVLGRAILSTNKVSDFFWAGTIGRFLMVPQTMPGFTDRT